MIDIIGILRWIRRRVEQIFEIVSSMLRLTETGGTITTDGTVQDIWISETPMGVFFPRKFQIDLTNMAVADSIRLSLNYRINPTGAKKKKDDQVYTGVQDPLLINIELEPNRYGIQITIERLAGADQSYDWCVFTGV